LNAAIGLVCHCAGLQVFSAHSRRVVRNRTFAATWPAHRAAESLGYAQFIHEEPAMNTENANVPDTRDTGNGTTAGAIIIAASLLSVLMMARHPSVATHDASKVFAEIADKAWIDRLVHGSLIFLLGAQVFGYIEFCSRLGFFRNLVRAGMIGYVIGVGALIGAALIDGFVVSDLGSHYLPARAEDLEAARHLLNLCSISVVALASLGVVATSVGFGLWSLALLRESRAKNIWLGALGMLLAAGPALAVLSGAIELHLHGMMLVILCQTVWNLAVGVQLLRGRI
jgi:hypothetical protein